MIAVPVKLSTIHGCIQFLHEGPKILDYPNKVFNQEVDLLDVKSFEEGN